MDRHVYIDEYYPFFKGFPSTLLDLGNFLCVQSYSQNIICGYVICSLVNTAQIKGM
jgi:hypothetical protein